MVNDNQHDDIVLDPTRDAFGGTGDLSVLGPTHFIGIGGAGMSVLAEMLHEQGVAVDGSDRERGAKTDRLESLGVRVEIGQRAENVQGASTVVFSSAIKPDNPEIVAAAQDGARIVHRSDILALLMASKRAVTVAGAHGKTTTSSMLAHILLHAGTGALADPSYAIGGSIQGPDGRSLDGGHAGAGDVLVAEADESDGSFGKYRPHIAIVTNAEPDHLDHYGDAAHYHAAFVDHLSHARHAIVMCVDDEGALDVLHALDPAVAARVVAYSTRPEAEVGDLAGATYVGIESEDERAGDGRERFVVAMPSALAAGTPGATGADGGDVVRVPVELVVPGIHNARNATAAIVAAALLGMAPHDAARAAGTFLGAARRFQLRGEVDGVSVVDDYAHHPTEIAALLDAARRRYPQSVIRVLFQPHLFSRTAFFADEFARALAKADDVIVSGIYPARERQEDFPGVGAGTIVAAAEGLSHDPQPWIEAVEDMHDAALALAARAASGDVLLTVGAGDVTAMGDVIVRALQMRGGDALPAADGR
ncbi:UDP-N-acetylmuramate--L-alanine ligase [Bifidobacterium samirii]|uniref:UDP-N-acetylmuramate--L-alanine ligase n=1 Tax=Bifidobacterium samirii TaxID=2306974 RepID=A0A430FUL5_9BIFI|nr:UDP-N-acetylmuramate--L-alanine ligase [Bifidobacterium samirii]RSX57010.1 UDP-N-acetylmuramate--L-alanine ligase [Bifidobacterium samirii]